jgi:hypothetical protein
LWAEAERPDEAARVMLLRGDAEVSSEKRLEHYVQAVALTRDLARGPSGAGPTVRDIARKKRALLAMEMVKDGAATAAARLDLHEAARELEAVGEPIQAAEAYRLAGDVDGEARALVAAGEVDRLEDLLTRDQGRARTEREQQAAHGEIERLLAAGCRRRALQRAEALARENTTDRAADERARSIRARRAAGPQVALERRGERIVLVLGDEILVGRTEGAIQVSSQAVSRRHLVLGREAGCPVVRDLGSRNGTEMRGVRVAGTLPVNTDVGPMVLKLGSEVTLTISPSDAVAGALAIDVAGARYVVPLAKSVRVGVGEWALDVADDGWIELATGDAPPARLGSVRLGAKSELLVGDTIDEVDSGAGATPAPQAAKVPALRVL